MSVKEFDTNTVLGLIVRLQSIKKSAQDMSFQPGSDPRYVAVALKVDGLVERLKKLVPAVMVAEIASIDKLTKELYQMLGEQEESEIAKKGAERGN